MAVDEGDQLKPLGQAPGSRQEAELVDACLDGLTGLLLETREESVGGAEVGEDNLAGLSVDALGGDDLPVAVAVDEFGGEGRHVSWHFADFASDFTCIGGTVKLFWELWNSKR